MASVSESYSLNSKRIHSDSTSRNLSFALSVLTCHDYDNISLEHYLHIRKALTYHQFRLFHFMVAAYFVFFPRHATYKISETVCEDLGYKGTTFSKSLANSFCTVEDVEDGSVVAMVDILLHFLTNFPLLLLFRASRTPALSFRSKYLPVPTAGESSGVLLRSLPAPGFLVAFISCTLNTPPHPPNREFPAPKTTSGTPKSCNAAACKSFEAL